MSQQWIKHSLLRTGALRLASQWSGPGVAILMYHSVMDDPASAEMTLGDIVHSTTIFRAQMEVVARFFRPVGLEDVLQFLKGEKGLPPRAVAVTFDDGYADNYGAANAILTPLGIPAAFYVTVECIERQRPPWPSLVRYAFLTSKKSCWSESGGVVWALKSTEQRMRAFQRAAEKCSMLIGRAQDDFVESLERYLETERPLQMQQLMMTWDQLRELARSGHIVGSHTMTHPNLAHVAESDARSELLWAKRELEQKLGMSVMHFAYPCPALHPHWSDRTVQTSREVGYKTAVTTDRGVVRRHDDPLSLRRIRPTKTIDGLRWNLEYAFLRSRPKRG
jgi:peptidoglycan/xylan/chitin deacetylase (PgdA/CDA1 family)